MDLNQILRKLGFKKNETRIYIALLEGGAASVAEIARKTALHRPLIYKAIPILIRNQLVSQTKKGKRVMYVAESPEQLDRMMSEVREEFHGLLPDLLQLFSNRAGRPLIRYFEGLRGIKAVYDDLLATCKKGSVIYRYESPKDYRKNKRYYPALYIKRVGAKVSEIERFVITNEKTHALRHVQLERMEKAVPAKFDLFEYDITEIIYGHKVAFIDFNTETASVIESAPFATFQRQIFKLLFEKL